VSPLIAWVRLDSCGASSISIEFTIFATIVIQLAPNSPHQVPWYKTVSVFRDPESGTGLAKPNQDRPAGAAAVRPPFGCRRAGRRHFCPLRHLPVPCRVAQRRGPPPLRPACTLQPALATAYTTRRYGIVSQPPPSFLHPSFQVS
jgi:hypothetical protein